VNRPGIAAALVTLAAAGSVVLVARQWAEPVPGASSEQVCQAVAELQDALDLSSLGDQAVLRARASRLADLLADPAPKEESRVSVAVARDIVAVLDDQRSTVADLAGAIAPIARQCSG
jgi:hypothetical protein